jgi:hypothetical protein
MAGSLPDPTFMSASSDSPVSLLSGAYGGKLPFIHALSMGAYMVLRRDGNSRQLRQSGQANIRL